MDNDTRDAMSQSSRPLLIHNDSPAMPLNVATTSFPANLSSFDNTDYLDDLNHEHVSELTPFLVYIVLLMIFGLLGNSVVFVVYYRKFKVNPTRTYILAMGVCDMLTNVFGLVTEFTDVYFQYTFYNDSACKFLKTVLSVLVLFSSFLLVTMALDRHQIVCGHCSRREHQKKVKSALAICCIVAASLSVPRPVLYWSNTNSLNGSVTCSNLNYSGTSFVLAYHFTLGTIFVLCLVILSVCYARIGLHLWRHKQQILHQKREADTEFRPEDNEKIGCGATSTNIDTDTNIMGSQLSISKQISSFRQGETNSSARNTQPQEDPESEPQNRRLEGAVKTATSTTTTTKHCPPGKRIPSRTTFMLFVLTVVFVLNCLPYLVTEGMLYVKPINPFREMNKSLQYVFLHSFYLNSAVNPLVYSFCSARFRYECWSLVCKKRQ